MHKKILIFLFILIISFLNCDDDTTQNQTTSESYPLEVNNEWIYYDDNANMYHRYEISGTSEHDQGFTTYNMNFYEDGVYQQTYHYYEDETGLYNYLSLTEDTHRTYLSYPLFVGKEWKDTYYGTEMVYNCTRQLDLTVPAGTFEDCYEITLTIIDTVSMTYYFKEDVGFVKINYPSSELFFDLQQFELY